MSSSLSSTDSAVTTVSAPGKVLLAGGYLVLESPNVGLVVAADKRFYCTVTHHHRDGDESRTNNNTMMIAVLSPQFHSHWNYQCRFSKEELQLSPDDSNVSENGFVEKTLRVVLGYLWRRQSSTHGGSLLFDQQQQQLPSKLDVVIRADNDFYSVLPHLQERGLESTPENVAKLPKFLPCPMDTNGKTIINKTGLGSSAALVTSLVGALLQSFDAIDLPKTTTTTSSSSTTMTADDSSLRVAHNLAQICHCHAQGKVGSGFDVSSAVFGSHVYRRFPKDVLTDLLQSLEEPPTSSSVITMSTANMLQRITLEAWSGGVQAPFQMPKGLELLLADVCGGSESPSMARTVLAWKKQQQSQIAANNNNDASSSQPSSYWENLVAVNGRIVSLFDQLSSTTSVQQHSFVLSRLTVEQWKMACAAADKSKYGGITSSYQKVVSLLMELRQALLEARSNLKAMGDAANVPIEPEEQTALANATMALPGVVAATVPGAGGYDALACLYIDDDEVRNRIGQLWATWQGSKDGGGKVCPLAVKSAGFGGNQGLCQTPISEETA